MGQPATAAIVVALIFAVPAALYVSWKGYTKYQRYRQARLVAHELPPIRDPIAAPTHGSASIPPYTSSPGTTPYGTWKASSSKGSLGAATSLGPGSMMGGHDGLGGTRSWRNSANGLMATPTFGADSTSAPASPLSLGADVALPSHSDPHHQYEHSRGISSSSSTMAIKRSYASSNRSGAASPTPFDRDPRRSSYLPHLPENRDSIQIIPPQPLGIGFGGMATATDQRTLAFSRQSGIGNDSDWSAGLAWAEQQSADAARTHMEEARSRYLAEGPSTKLSASPVGSNRSGSGAGGAGGLSPGGGSSRSVSSRRSQNSEYRDPNAPYSSPPSSNTRKPAASSGQPSRRPLLQSSSHSSGVSFDDRPPSPSRYEDAQPNLGPSTPPSAYVPPGIRGTPLNAQNIAAQSPLQGLSNQWGRPTNTSAPHNAEPSPLPVAGQERITRHRPHASGTIDDSPILSAFRVGGSGGAEVEAQHSGGTGTPALASRAASGSGSNSASSATGPATDSSGRPSASADTEAPPDVEADLEKGTEAQKASGWGLTSLLGMKA